MSQVKLTADSGGGTTSLKAPSSTTSNADVVLKLPVADGSSGQVLKTDGSGQLSFTSNAGTTINNQADNRLITCTGTTGTLNGESELTYSSPQLKLLSTSAAPQIRINSAADDGAATRFTIGRATANNNFVNGATSGDSVITFGTNLLFGVQTAEKMRIDSSGRLLLGTTTEGQANADNLTIDGGDAETGITIRSGTSRGNHIYFSDGTSGDDEYRGIISYQHSDNKMQFFTNASERIRIDSNGDMILGSTSSLGKLTISKVQNNLSSAGGFANPHLRLNATTTTDNNGFTGVAYSVSELTNYGWTAGAQRVSTGGTDGAFIFRHHSNSATGNERVRLLSSGGITFNGDTAAANALDDYEEGTFTPDWNGSSAGTTTYSTNNGSYTKIGNIVHIRIYSGINGTSGTGAWRVTNLPFSSPNGLAYITTGSCMVDGLNFDSNYTWVVPYKNQNSSHLDLYASKDDGGWDQVNISDDSSFGIILGITYTAA